MPNHLEAARHIIEGFGDLVADPAQRAAVGRTGARCGMDYVLARQVFRQRAPCWSVCLDRARDRCSDHRRGGREPLGLIALQCFDCQLEWFGLARQLLRRATELGPAITSELEAQLGDLGLGGDRILRHRRDDLL